MCVPYSGKTQTVETPAPVKSEFDTQYDTMMAQSVKSIAAKGGTETAIKRDNPFLTKTQRVGLDKRNEELANYGAQQLV